MLFCMHKIKLFLNLKSVLTKSANGAFEVLGNFPQGVPGAMPLLVIRGGEVNIDLFYQRTKLGGL